MGVWLGFGSLCTLGSFWITIRRILEIEMVVVDDVRVGGEWLWLWVVIVIYRGGVDVGRPNEGGWMDMDGCG